MAIHTSRSSRFGVALRWWPASIGLAVLACDPTPAGDLQDPSGSNSSVAAGNNTSGEDSANAGNGGQSTSDSASANDEGDADNASGDGAAEGGVGSINCPLAKGDPEPPLAREYGGSNKKEDNAAFPNTIALPAPCLVPVGGVNLKAGSDLQAAFDSNPPGTQFNLAAGTWKGAGVSVSPKAGQIIAGAGAGKTILNGIAIRYDGGGDVKVFNLTVTGNNWDQHAAIDSDFNSAAGSGWIVANVEAHHNFQGIVVGSDSLIQNSYAHDNAVGSIGGGGKGSIIRYNAMIHNNCQGIPDPNAAFANSKSGALTAVRVKRNLIGDGCGMGWWCDVGCKDLVVEENVVYRNSRAGILDEISDGNDQFLGNITIGNGFDSVDWHDTGIILSTTHDAIAKGNFSLRNRTGAIDAFAQDNRQPWYGGRNKVTNNTLDTDAASGGNPVGGKDTIAPNTVVAADKMTVPLIYAGPQM